MRSLIVPMLALVVLLSSRVQAQFDLGVSAGASLFTLSDGPKSDLRSFYAEPASGFTAGTFARGRTKTRFGYGLEVYYSQWSFTTRYSQGGLSYISYYTTSVRVDLLHIALVPSIRLDRRGIIRLRMGLLVGGPLGGTEHVRVTDGTYTEEAGAFVRKADKYYQRDGRILLGAGLRIPISTWGAVLLEPWAAASLTAMRKDSWVRAYECGVRVGVAWVIDVGRFREKENEVRDVPPHE
ncbi:MAG: outer membrane beta-barrel protein [Flavobacteriales bacterium]|nr:outer membrane beta-barrel protein [Flavobacteriales bacterium]MBP6699527.1 outer membrane beta-barrel protein [Flavobacteriales bacterium]